MSILSAASLTTAAFENARFCFGGGPFSELLNITDHQGLYYRYIAFREAAFGVNHSESTPKCQDQDSVFFSGRGLDAPWQAIIDCKKRKYKKKRLEASVLEKPSEHVTVEAHLSDRPRQLVAERALMDMLLKNMRRFMFEENQLRPEFIMDMNPLVADLKEFQTAKSSSIETSVIFGLQLLVESYKSFILSGPTPNCRIQALKFAQHVRKSMDRLRQLRPFEAMKACTCDECIGDSLPIALCILEKDLLAFTSERRFDLYYQAPWIAGHQMGQILTRVTNLGLRLCNIGQYAGTVLHLYNLLRHFHAIDEEATLLDNLCGVLGQYVFSSSRPEQNFFAQYASFMGGRLEFDRSKRQKNQHDDIGLHCNRPVRNWRIAMPKKTAKKLISHDVSKLVSGLE